MSSERLQKWALTAEIIGGIAIVVSLIFVGFEVRQSAAAQRGATVLQLKQDWVDLNLMMASNPDLAAVWDHMAKEGFESLDRKERFLLTAHIRGVLHILSNAHYQYRLGTLEQEQWDSLIQDIDTMTRPSAQSVPFWAIWSEWEHIFDEPFRELINSRRPSE